MKILILILLLLLPVNCFALEVELNGIDSIEELDFISVCIDGYEYIVTQRYQTSYGHRATGIGIGIGITQVMVWDENLKSITPKQCIED